MPDQFNPLVLASAFDRRVRFLRLRGAEAGGDRPILRALAARAPYFHNGSATLGEAVDFHNTRFNIGLTLQEKSDLVAFLNAL